EKSLNDNFLFVRIEKSREDLALIMDKCRKHFGLPIQGAYKIKIDNNYQTIFPAHQKDCQIFFPKSLMKFKLNELDQEIIFNVRQELIYLMIWQCDNISDANMY